MKPLTLRMQAFGPYGGVVEVDFDRLRAVGLFVVSGPTGAGKTSIFDAMGYALYNDLPGERGGFKDIRSDHADPTVLCEVVFEFEADGDRWQVTRVPTQERAKKRGSGLAKENASAVLDRWVDGAWAPVESSVTGVTNRCTELVGLDAKQFQRVMLLPQGQFQQVLKADSKDRRKLLRTLFGSGLYESIEAELKERAKSAEATLAELARSVGADQEAAAVSYAEAAEAAHAGEAVVLGDGASLEEIDQAAATLRGDCLAAMDRAQVGLIDAANVSNAALQTAIDQERTRQRRTELVLKRSALADVAGAMAADELRVEQARQARPIIELQTVLSTQQRVSTEAQADAGRRASMLEEAGAALGFAGDLLGPEDLEVARAWASTIERDAQRAIEELERAASLRASAAEADRVADESTANAAELKRQQELIHERQEGLERKQGELLRLAESLLQRQAELATATTLHTHGARLVELDQKLSELTSEDDSLAEQLLVLKQRLAASAEQAAAFEQRVRQLPDRIHAAELAGRKAQDRQRLDEADQQHSETAARYTAAKDAADVVLRSFEAAAGPRLAKALVADQPCSVCGSTNHPAPAVDAGSGVETVDLAAVEAAQAEVTAAAAAMSEANEKRAALVELLGNDATTPRASLDVAASQARELVSDSTQAERELASNQAEREGLDQRYSDSIARHTELAAKRTAVGADRARSDGALGDAAKQPIDQLETNVSVARQQVSAAEQAGVEGADVERALANAAATNESLTAQLANEEQRRIEALKTRDLHRAEAAALAARTNGDEANLRTTLAAASGFLTGVDLLDRAWRSVAAAKVRVDAMKSQQQTNLNESTFDSLGQAVAAGLEADAAQALGAAVQTWKTEVTSVDSALAEIDRAPLPSEVPDIDALRADAAEAASHARTHQERLTRARLHLDQLAATVERGRASEAAVRERQVTAQRVKELADICVGNGPLRRSLESWVLAAHLRDVVELANQHLAPMSSGRYELIVSETTDDRRSQSGLELTVLDARSGKPRPVASLSGGETFQASLALALGLADVVSANRGGIQLDALFVDEGFGSLDAESLDHAIDVLDGLRSRGALVGVITHVEALKRALQVGIEVERHADGSGSVLKQLI